jgi:shikimate dehydrogenase
MRVFGLIGHPLSHSWSAEFWNAAFARNAMHDCVYRNYDLADVHELTALINAHPNIEGLNVTIPHKTAAMPLLDHIDSVAAAIGAVNTIHIIDGKTTGYNTDAEGFRRSIRPFLESTHDKALVLGTGGASKAVQHVLRSLGIAVFLVSRRADEGALTYEALSADIVKNCRLIVNCTPVGMTGFSDDSPIQTDGIGPQHLVVDLIYNPKETLLLRAARGQGAIAINGADMLRFQAEEAMRIFFGRVL